jgi:hypothetical protein
MPKVRLTGSCLLFAMTMGEKSSTRAKTSRCAVVHPVFISIEVLPSTAYFLLLGMQRLNQVAKS